MFSTTATAAASTSTSPARTAGPRTPLTRTGPEFAGAAPGDFELQVVPLTPVGLEGIDLRPAPLAAFVLGHLRAGTDLFTLADLRTTRT